MDDVEEHSRYVADTARLGAYAVALRAVIRPGDVVLDLGTGTGVLGLLAAQMGATRVYAVDEGRISNIAQAGARNNALGVMTVIRGHSTDLDLPELVDVVICDQAGPLGFAGNLVHSMHDAAERVLRPGGSAIPFALDLLVAPISDAALRLQLDGWLARPHGIDLSFGHAWAVHHVYARPAAAVSALATPTIGMTLATTEAAELLVDYTATITIATSGQLDALGCGWIAHLAPSVTMSNWPGRDDMIDREIAALPLDHGVEVRPGDEVKTRIRGRTGSDLLSWSVTVTRPDTTDPLHDRQYSTFLAAPLSQLDLAELT
ncbi:MAG TPA: 50S ribosomal protein L11 methyltransferase [Acidimicrobiia bacterium]|jgi:protein arginine N-methyltransferase 1